MELSGNPVDIEIIAITPQSKVSARMGLSLRANEFRQLDRVLRQLGFPSTTNARIAIRAIGGAGTVSGYAAVIDNISGDPTYVPAQ